VGTVNLNTGGTLRVGRVGTATGSANATQNGSTAIFNFNGGTPLGPGEFDNLLPKAPPPLRLCRSPPPTRLAAPS